MTLEVLHKGQAIERHDNMILRPGDDNDLFTVINRDSGVIVAIDPCLSGGPSGLGPRTDVPCRVRSAGRDRHADICRREPDRSVGRQGRHRRQLHQPGR